MGWIASRFRRRRSDVAAERPAEAREPEPAPQAAPQPEPPPAEPEREAAPIAEQREAPPREWNLWDLERIARDHAAEDVARNEERAYLLMYLREFATADGILPADFDSLVRESFGDALDPAYS